ncbi:MAG TPA: hypothetical protein VLE43_14430 [Candidatus Saccharimonadia bacterium]|nr:hypothetical protein [Candidatus Saccharimonadia bacterium]
MPVCPVCGYPKLAEPPRTPSGGGSYEICPSCGFQFGVDDDDRCVTLEQARKEWVAAGMKWSSKGIHPPKGWDPGTQLATLQPAKKAARKPSPASSRKAPAPAKKKPGGRR